MKQLTLEEVLGIAKQVKRWRKKNTLDQLARYSGGFYPEGSFSKVKIKVSELKDKYGEYYTVSVDFQGATIVSDASQEAEKIYNIAKDSYTQAHPITIKWENKIRKMQEEALEQKVDVLRDALAKKPDKLPWYRRLGR